MNKLLLVLLLILVVMSGCNKDEVDSPIYRGDHLSIGVIGESPNVREQNINFNSITLEELKTKTEQISSDFDAVFIMNEHLSQAAESQYSSVYGITIFKTLENKFKFSET